MRNAAKFAFALLLGLFLTGTPGALTASAPASAKADCACAGCRKMCCAPRNAPAPQPVAPARSASPEQLLFVALWTRLAALPAAPAAQVFTPSSSAPFAVTPVPLYQRNCSYLI